MRTSASGGWSRTRSSSSSCAIRSTGPTRTGRICGRPGWRRSRTSSPPASGSRGAGPPAGPTSGTTSASACTAARCATCSRRSARDQLLVMRYRDLSDEPVATLDRVCRFLGVATGVVGEVPPENVRAYVADSPVERGSAVRAAQRRPGRAALSGARTAGRERTAVGAAAPQPAGLSQRQWSAPTAVDPRPAGATPAVFRR